MHVTVFHNIATDHQGRPLGMMDGYTAGHPLVPVLETEVPRPGDSAEARLMIVDAIFALLNVGDDPAYGTPDPRAVAYRERKNRSLSVGDVVRVGSTWYACQRGVVGWTEIEAPAWLAGEASCYGTTSILSD